MAGRWKIADCQRSVSYDGNWWHVFTIDAKTNKLKWSCDKSDSKMWNLAAEKAAKNNASFFDSYVGPFPGRFFRHSQTHHRVAVNASQVVQTRPKRLRAGH